MGKQLSIAGTEPERDAFLEDAIEELRLAREAHKRAAEAVHKLEAAVVQRMIDSKAARYDHTDSSGGEWSLALNLPSPTVSLKYVGNRNGDHDR